MHLISDCLLPFPAYVMVTELRINSGEKTKNKKPRVCLKHRQASSALCCLLVRHVAFCHAPGRASQLLPEIIFYKRSPENKINEFMEHIEFYLLISLSSWTAASGASWLRHRSSAVDPARPLGGCNKWRWKREQRRDWQEIGVLGLGEV